MSENDYENMIDICPYCASDDIQFERTDYNPYERDPKFEYMDMFYCRACGRDFPGDEMQYARKCAACDGRGTSHNEPDESANGIECRECNGNGYVFEEGV